MSYGLTTSGFSKKPLSIIKTEIEDALKTLFGPYINVLPSSVFGNITSVFSDREDQLWNGWEDTYDSQYPASAEGVSLDGVCSITGTTRSPATYSTVTEALFGTATTVVPAGTIISVSGDPNSRFETLEDKTIDVGVDNVQLVSYSDVPDAGSFKLKYWNDLLSAYEITAALPYNASITDIENALNALTGLSGLVVTGDFTVGHTVTFSGDDGKQPHEILVEDSNTLTKAAAAITITITETIPGEYQATVLCQAESTGPVVANTKTLTVIETPVSGLDSLFNISDASVGRNIETDSELRLKRIEELERPGAGTVETIRARILAEVDGIENCIVFENDSNAVDVNGLPPKSIRAYVKGGTDQDIAEKIWLVKGGGIEPDGSVNNTVVDSQGISRTIKFSRPLDKNIWVEVDITKTSEYGGDSAVEQAILAYGADLQIGSDVIAHGNPSIEKSISTVAGITDIVIRIGFASSPTTDDNLVIAINEIAIFDSARITVNS